MKKTKGDLLKEMGIKQVEANSRAAWMDGSIAIIAKRAKVKGEFNYETVEEEVLKTLGCPHHPNAIGALMRKAKNLGIIKAVGFKKASRSSCHSRIVRVYVGADFY